MSASQKFTLMVEGVSNESGVLLEDGGSKRLIHGAGGGFITGHFIVSVYLAIRKL